MRKQFISALCWDKACAPRSCSLAVPSGARRHRAHSCTSPLFRKTWKSPYGKTFPNFQTMCMSAAGNCQAVNTTHYHADPLCPPKITQAHASQAPFITCTIFVLEDVWYPNSRRNMLARQKPINIPFGSSSCKQLVSRGESLHACPYNDIGEYTSLLLSDPDVKAWHRRVLYKDLGRVSSSLDACL